MQILFTEESAAVEWKVSSGEDISDNVPGAIRERVEGIRTLARAMIFRGSPFEKLARFCLLFFLLMFVKNFFGYMSTYLTIFLEQSILHNIRRKLYGRMQDLPLSFFERRRTGDLISRITSDVTNLRGTIVGSLASLIRNSLMTAVAAVIIFYTSWKLALLTVIIVPVNILMISVIGGKLRKRSRRAQERMSDMTSVIQETVSGIRVVKAFRMEEREKRKFDLFSARYLMEYLRMRKYAELASPGSEMLALVASVIIIWYGGRLVISGEISASYLIMFIVAMLWVVGPVRNLSKLNNVVQVGLASGRRVFEIIDAPGEYDDPGGIVIDDFEKEIAYRNVSFAYRKGTTVLSGIDMVIRKGEVVALVGPSGAGKSTIADLLPRFYRPDSGAVTIDGRDITTIDLASLRSMIGVVTQETVLFNDTILNNIAYADSTASIDRVVEVAKAANAHDFISALPDRYDSVVGDRGAQLSGGERQRIAIARALLKNPRILILDEATSALDSESEKLVQEAIERLVKGRTTLVIAHRLSTVRNADRIVVIKDGRVDQSGSHAELIEKDGIYRMLFDLQTGIS